MKFLVAVVAAGVVAAIMAFLSNAEVVPVAAITSVIGASLYCFSWLVDTIVKSGFPFVRLIVFMSIVCLGFGRSFFFTTEAAPMVGFFSFHLIVGYVISALCILVGR